MARRDSVSGKPYRRENANESWQTSVGGCLRSTKSAAWVGRFLRLGKYRRSTRDVATGRLTTRRLSKNCPSVTHARVNSRDNLWRTALRANGGNGGHSFQVGATWRGYWFKHAASQILRISIHCNESYCAKGKTVRLYLLMAIIFIFASSQLQATRVNVACFGKEGDVLKIKHAFRHLLKVRFEHSNACRSVRKTLLTNESAGRKWCNN